jgi:type II restriction enzyme
MLRLDLMPQVARIVIIKDSKIAARNEVLRLWSASQKVLTLSARKRGWLADIVRCVERVDPIFSIGDIYHFKTELGRAHIDNHNIEAKIRQQLQVLRDLGMVEFIRPGIYRRLLGS